MTSPDDTVLTTERLSLHRLSLDDAGYVLELVNEAAFMQFVGDKGLRTIDDARRYIRDVPLADYARYGYGGYLVRRRADRTPVGLCGLYQRPNLDHPDLGFALSHVHVGRGYAYEASLAVVDYAGKVLALPRVAALVDSANERSIHLIERLGFGPRGSFLIPGEERPLRYYCLEFQPE